MLRIFVFGPNFVFRTNFVFATEFRLQHAPNRISSSHEFRLQGRFSSTNIVFAHNLSFSSWRTISSSKASEFRLQGGDETGTQFPGSMHICTHVCVFILIYACVYIWVTMYSDEQILSFFLLLMVVSVEDIWHFPTIRVPILGS